MKRPQLAAEALAAWTIETLRAGEKSVSQQQLPEIDLQSFFRAFAGRQDLPDRVSLAMAGFGATSAGLEAMAKKAGARCFAQFANDLHAAAKWRNDRKRHPVILAFARGTVTGLNTLQHFARATSRDLTAALLAWAGKRREFTLTPAHGRLLEEIQSLIEDSDAFSFEQVRAFLEAWTKNSGAGAPRLALPALGLLPDPNLFADGTLIRQRLEFNRSFMAALRDRTAGQMEAVRKRLRSAADASTGRSEARARLRTFERLQDVRRTPNAVTLGAVSLDEGLRVFAPTPKPTDDDPSEDPTEQPETRTLNEKRLQKTAAEALLDDREKELVQNADSLSKGIRDSLDDGEETGDENHWQAEVHVNGEPHAFHAELDRRFVAWVRHFCKPGVWGGLIQTTIPDLRKALEDYDRPDTLQLDPENLLRIRREDLGLTKLLTGWQDDLAAQISNSAEFIKLWTSLKALRAQLLDCLEELTHFPLEWFAGNPAVRSLVRDYLAVTGKLFGLVASNYGAMTQKDPNWAKTTLEGLLALDVVQVRVQQEDGKIASKAVLLPTHPLHLWRYWRLSNLLRGLGKDLNESDRNAVVQEAADPIQFLSVIYASPLPGGRGAAQVLPVANDLHRLATFENLRNAYNGADGQQALAYAVERFAAAHPRHVNPLRLVVVNVPQPGTLLLDLLRLLDGRKRSLLPSLRVEVRGTPLQAPRLRDALLFDTREREIIEEKIASGRLQLVVDRAPRVLDEILEDLKTSPAHIVAVFDEAPVSVRRGGAGERLPMSPFCVRRKVAFHKRWNELRLEPTSGDPPFFEFIELVKHVEGNEGEGTPYAWPEAEALRKSVDSLLMPEDFGSQWFFLADRALPEEGEMEAQRLVRRREGQRYVLLATRDYESLAQLMLPTFEEDIPNLLMPVPRLKELLGEGAHLVGAGLLDVVKSQENRVVPARVIGLMGTLLAARDYLRRHPEALLVSTDSQLARTWLRLGTQGDRCDLFAVREESSRIVVECLEVKATRGKPRSQIDQEISRACLQVAATVGAVREGLGDTRLADSRGHYLAAPRNEMLKEVLVQGCMGRFASRDERSRWAAWLERLFGPNPEAPELRGTVIDVAFGSAEVARTEYVERNGTTVALRHLNEIDVQRLLEPPAETDPSPPSPDEAPPPPSTKPIAGTGAESILSAHGAEGTRNRNVSEGVARKAVQTTRDEQSPQLRTRSVADTASEPPPVPRQDSDWPPSPNVFGLIGQEAAATKLHNKAELSRGTKRRFTDTLFIGPAGVGKSSLARAVAKQLLAEDPVFFSGSDLPHPSALISKLQERSKVPKKRSGRIQVKKCLVFIDEVHALGKPTATALLSAMDDARVATIGGVEYDFRDVVFIAATTDKGLLTDAFVSRMDLIPLASYSLDELAGIICHHGKQLFGDYELPREVCVEVAARCRCNPRRAVRSLENDLLAEFYNKLPPSRRKGKGAERAASALMNVDAVAGYYESHGIDLNGLDDLGRKTLAYLKTHGPSPEDRISKGLRISNRADFVELIEFLTRLGLVATTHQGRHLTGEGRRYLASPVNLRDRI